jgi:N-acetylglutamate synthase-like GNAT family acetyltransferase
MEWQQGEYALTTDPARIDLDVVHGFLTTSYWARGISRELVARAIQGSMPFVLTRNGKQIGFARIISDLATFAYLGDVFVLQSERGRGAAKWMMECIASHPGLAGIRRFHLVTHDAHGLYEQFGFKPLAHPQRHMEKVLVNPYAVAS